MEALRTATPLWVWREVLTHPDSQKNVGLSLRAGSAENHYFMAFGALRRNESLKHGLEHLADLLAYDPACEAHLAMLETYRERIGRIEPSLGKPGGKPYFAIEALRAYEWARSGDVDRALGLLADVASAKPSARYLDTWGLAWAGAAPASIDAAVLGRTLSAVTRTFPEHAELTVPREDAARAWARLALAEADRLRRSGLRAGMVDMIVAGLCRRAGLFDEGLAFAQAADPSWETWTACGLLHRHRGATDAALAAFVEAIAIAPTNVATYLEAGDACFDAERWADARAYYERALAVQADSPWAIGSIACTRWLEHGPAPAPAAPLPAEIAALSRAGNGRVREVLRARSPFVGYVPEPHDAIANVLRQLRPGTSATCTSSDVEAPSNLVLAKMLGIPLTPTWSHVATPDPREPVADIAFPLFRREGDVLVPALPPPAAEIAARIAALAALPFRRARAWAAASRVAGSLAATDAVAVLACAVHPPVAPEGVTPMQWLPRVQLAAAFVVAQLASDEPWERSTRRAAILSLLHGPMDWTTEHAVIALTQLVHDEPLVLTEVHAALATLLAARPDSGGCPWETTLLYEWLGMPGLFPDEQSALRTRLDRVSPPPS